MRKPKPIIFESLLLISVVLWFASCNIRTATKELHDAELRITDSVALDIPKNQSLIVRDYSTEYQLFLTYNSNTEDVFLFKKDGSIFSQFNRSGSGVFEYGSIFSISFFTDSTLIINSLNELLIFDFHGKCLYEERISAPYFMAQYINNGIGANYLCGADTLVVLPVNDYQTVDRASQVMVTVQNISVNTFEAITWEPESFYYDKDDYYIPEWEPFFTTDSCYLYVGYPYDSKIFCYDLTDSSKLKTTFELDKTVVDQVTLESLKKARSDQSEMSGLNAQFENPNFSSLEVCDTLLYVTYKSSLDECYFCYTFDAFSEKLPNVHYIDNILQIYSPTTQYCDILLKRGTRPLQLVNVDKAHNVILFGRDIEIEDDGWVYFGEIIL